MPTNGSGLHHKLWALWLWPSRITTHRNTESLANPWARNKMTGHSRNFSPYGFFFFSPFVLVGQILFLCIVEVLWEWAMSKLLNKCTLSPHQSVFWGQPGSCYTASSRLGAINVNKMHLALNISRSQKSLQSSIIIFTLWVRKMKDRGSEKICPSFHGKPVTESGAEPKSVDL